MIGFPRTKPNKAKAHFLLTNVSRYLMNNINDVREHKKNPKHSSYRKIIENAHYLI